MRVAVGQFAVTPEWRVNAQTCVSLMQKAAEQGAELLVLPEALLARDDRDPDLSVKSAQPLDGDFIGHLKAQSRCDTLTTIFTVHTPASDGRARNTLVALRAGEVIAHYHKLHLYDAFSIQESRRVDAGQALPPLIEVAGFKVGVMTCYDLRFPDMAVALALQGAELLALPAAWVRGPLKEHHWSTLLAARALDTTCYVVASGECGTRNIGQSYIIDPLGVTLAGAGMSPQLIISEVSREHLLSVRQQLPVLENRRFALPQLI